MYLPNNHIHLNASVFFSEALGFTAINQILVFRHFYFIPQYENLSVDICKLTNLWPEFVCLGHVTLFSTSFAVSCTLITSSNFSWMSFPSNRRFLHILASTYSTFFLSSFPYLIFGFLSVDSWVSTQIFHNFLMCFYIFYHQVLRDAFKSLISHCCFCQLHFLDLMFSYSR